MVAMLFHWRTHPPWGKVTLDERVSLDFWNLVVQTRSYMETCRR